MEIGLVGLPNAGKSTLFNALTKIGAPAAPYAFTTIDPNIGVVSVPDERFDALCDLMKPKNIVPAAVRFVDIAGLVKGASKGEGLGNQFLHHIREVDAVAHVIRCFNGDVPLGKKDQVDPKDDIDTINTELALADLSTCEKRMLHLAKTAKSGEKESLLLTSELNEIVDLLAEGKPARAHKNIALFADLHLLTAKPMIFVANISEEDYRAGDFTAADPVRAYAQAHQSDSVVVAAKIEAELAELEADDAAVFRQELGIDVAGLNILIRAAYHTLGLMSFFTVGADECRAWNIKQGATALDAAAAIHTDLARGFIKAEVIDYELFLADGSLNRAKEKGDLRLEGKDYPVRDGEIVHIKFNV